MSEQTSRAPGGLRLEDMLERLEGDDEGERYEPDPWILDQDPHAQALASRGVSAKFAADYHALRAREALERLAEMVAQCGNPVMIVLHGRPRESP